VVQGKAVSIPQVRNNTGTNGFFPDAHMHFPGYIPPVPVFFRQLLEIPGQEHPCKKFLLDFVHA
jgi:hypothetical protein